MRFKSGSEWRRVPNLFTIWPSPHRGRARSRRTIKHLAPAIEQLEDRALLSATFTPRLLKNINPATLHANPENLTNVNGTLFFAADNGTVGRELWKSDGTAAGTVLVKNITPGAAGSTLGNFTNVAGTLFFTVDTNSGTQLWKSDGTAAGTVLVRGNVLANGNWNPQQLTAVDGKLFFTAENGSNGRELWTSGGTASSTVLVQDILPGAGSSNPLHLTASSGKLFFSADDGANGRELWTSNGTAAGTNIVLDIHPNSGSNPDHLTDVNGTLYFTATTNGEGEELWKSNGTANGTVIVQDILPGAGSSSPRELTNVNGTVYFIAESDSNGNTEEIWKSNGTAAGTTLVRSINHGGGQATLKGLTASGNFLYFINDLGAQEDLWRSNGTAQGTEVLASFFPPFRSLDFIRNLTDVNGTLFFYGQDSENGPKLWKSDGTQAGTTLLQTVHAGPEWGNPHFLVNVNGTLMFRAYSDRDGLELWKSDGTASGTRLVRDINAQPAQVEGPSRAINYNGRLYFTADNYTHGRELWTSNGTTSGTNLFRDIFPGDSGSFAGEFTKSKGWLFFIAADDAGAALWRTNGTAAGTVRLTNLTPARTGFFPPELVDVNGTLYFTMGSNRQSLDGTPWQGELWKSDGTQSGTTFVQGFTEGFPRDLTSANGRLYFRIFSQANGVSQLWQSNGTASSTRQVRNGPVSELTAVNGHLFFQESGGLWWHNGTNSRQVRQYPEDVGIPHSFVSAGNLLYLRVGPTELWRSDGTNAGTIRLLQGEFDANDPNGGGPAELTDIDGLLYFTFPDAARGRELWKSDGTPNGTVLLRDLVPGPASSSPTELTNVKGRLFLRASNGLWTSDGTPAGTRNISDITASNLSDGGRWLFFAGLDEQIGLEPHVIDVSPLSLHLLGRTAGNLDRTRGLTLSRYGLFENWGGKGDKWVQGQGDEWYFILPNGEFYLWDGNRDGELNGTLQATLAPRFHEDPSLLYDAQHYYLDRELGLYKDGNGFFENWGGEGEKWLRSRTGTWYFIKPNGEFYEWDGGNGLTGLQVATLDPAYHIHPELLYEQAQPSYLDRLLGLFPYRGDFSQNWGKRNEKWLQGADNRFYFITPNGQLYQWDRSGSATGELIATFDPALHATPYRLSNAHGLALQKQFNLTWTGSLLENWGGKNEKWMRSHYRQWYFITPDGALTRWDGGDDATGRQVAQLQPMHYTDPSLIFDALAHQLDLERQLFQQNGTYYQNAFGKNEKWMRSIDTSGPWYYILPGGELYRWNGRRDGELSGTLVAKLEPRHYTTPATLHDTRAYYLDRWLGLHFRNSYFVNWGGLNEKWVGGSGNTWYFLTGTGSFYQWHGGDIRNRTLIAAIDPAYHTQPESLHEAYNRASSSGTSSSASASSASSASATTRSSEEVNQDQETEQTAFSVEDWKIMDSLFADSQLSVV